MENKEIEKLNQIISRTDISGNQKVNLIIDLIEKRDTTLLPSSNKSMQKLNEVWGDDKDGKYKKMYLSKIKEWFL